MRLGEAFARSNCGRITCDDITFGGICIFTRDDIYNIPKKLRDTDWWEPVIEPYGEKMKRCKDCKYNNRSLCYYHYKPYELHKGTRLAMEASTLCGLEGRYWQPSLWYRIKRFFIGEKV